MGAGYAALHDATAAGVARSIAENSVSKIFIDGCTPMGCGFVLRFHYLAAEYATDLAEATELISWLHVRRR